MWHRKVKRRKRIMNHNIDIEVGYTLDKAGLQQVLSSLQAVIGETKKNLNAKDLTNDLKASNEQVKSMAQNLQNILSTSWNPKLNQLDLSKVQTQIKNTYGDVSNLQIAFSKIGTVGAQGYSIFAREILNTNLQLKQTNKLVDQLAVSMGNTIKWGATSSVFNLFTSSIQKA